MRIGAVRRDACHLFISFALALLIPTLAFAQEPEEVEAPTGTATGTDTTPESKALEELRQLLADSESSDTGEPSESLEAITKARAQIEGPLPEDLETKYKSVTKALESKASLESFKETIDEMSKGKDLYGIARLNTPETLVRADLDEATKYKDQAIRTVANQIPELPDCDTTAELEAQTREQLQGMLFKCTVVRDNTAEVLDLDLENQSDATLATLAANIKTGSRDLPPEAYELALEYPTVRKRITRIRAQLDKIDNDCNLTPNEPECFDGKWLINAGILWNVLAPQIQAQDTDLASAIGLNLQYRSRWFEFTAQFGVNPEILDDYSPQSRRDIGFTTLRPSVSPFSLSIEGRGTLKRSLIDGMGIYYNCVLVCGPQHFASSPEGRNLKGLDWFEHTFLHGIPRSFAGGYVRVGGQVWKPFDTPADQDPAFSGTAFPVAWGVTLATVKYNTRYHSLLKNKTLDIGRDSGYLQLYTDVNLAGRHVFGDVNVVEVEDPDDPDAEAQTIAGTLTELDDLSLYGLEPVLGIRLSKVFVEGAFLIPLAGGMRNFPGIGAGQFTIRVGLESEFLNISADSPDETPSASTDSKE
jgi:hypothetical protein